MSRSTGFAARVIRGTAVIARRRARFVLVLVAIDAIPQMALAFTPGDTQRLSSLFGLLTLYLQLRATFGTLEDLGLLPPDHDRRRPTEGRYPSAFLLSLLTMLGILIGLAALVIPGLLLVGLWGMSLPVLAAERRRPVDAMRRSWRLARSRLAAMLLLAAAWLGGLALVIAISATVALATGVSDPAIDATADLGLSFLLILGPMMWTVAYAERLAEVGRPGEGAT